MAELGALTVAVRMSSDGIVSEVSRIQEQLGSIESSADGVDKAMDKAGKAIDQGAAKQAAAFAVVAAVMMLTMLSYHQVFFS